MKLNFQYLFLVIVCGIFNFNVQVNAENEICGKIAAGVGYIVGGDYTVRGAFPWTAVLTTNEGKLFCGGTLLQKNKVLTAAHCIHGKDNAYKFESENIRVILGAHNISNTNEDERIRVGVKKIQIHRDWNITTESFDADIAILTLSRDVTFTRYIQPICLTDSDSNVASIYSGYSVGYGKSEDESKDHEDVLKYIQTPILNSNEECFYTNEFLLKLSSPRTFCGGTRGGTGVCLGDSGNGLFVEQNGVHYIRGIVSSSLLSHRNCDVNNYAIFTNVLKFFDWIVEKINSDKSGIRNGPRVSLIGSHFLPVNSNYKAFLFAKQLDQDLNINATLFAEGYAKSLNFDDLEENFVNDVEFELPQQKQRDYTLKLSASTQNQCMNQAVKILNLQEYPLIFIYIDKPVYKPGEIMKFRLFILNQKLLPFKGQPQINVKLFDSMGNLVQIFKNVRTSKFGLFEQSIAIPDNQNIGKWKIEVQANNRRKSKEFEVQPDFDVFLDVPETLAFNDQNFGLKIFVKSENDKFLDGSFKILYKLGNFQNQFLKSGDLNGIKTEVILNFAQNLNIPSLNNDTDLTLIVQVTDVKTQNILEVRKTIELKHKDKHIIQVIRKRFFKPGFDFPIKIRVKNMNGIPDTSLSHLKMTIEYKSKDGNTLNKKTSTLKLTNGVASDVLHPRAPVHKIIINIDIDGTMHEEYVEKLSVYGIDEYMQVNFVKKSSKVDDTVQIKAETTGEMKTLNVMVFGTNGLIFNEEFPDAAGKDIFTFSFELTEEMRPEARGLVFYVRPQDGVMVYDEFVISLGFTIENSLDISLPLKYSKPNEELVITIKSEKGSLIFLTAVDENSELLGKENQISRNDIYNELTYYLSLKLPNSHDYKFEKLNNFVLEPLQNGINCGKKSKLNLIKSNSTAPIPWTQNYFPNIWFDKVFEMKSGNSQTIKVKIPNGLQTWKIYGISVHPTKGFTVARSQPKITIESDVAVQIRAPEMVYENEIFKVDIKVINIFQNEVNVKVHFEIENGIFQNMTASTEASTTCYSFKPLSDQNPNFRLDLKSTDKSKSEIIFIKPINAGKLRIKAIATVNGYSHEDERKVEVQKVNFQLRTENNFFVNWTIYDNGNEHARMEIDAKVKSDQNVTLEVEMPRGYIYTGQSHGDEILIRNNGRLVILTKYQNRESLFGFIKFFGNLPRTKRYSVNMMKIFDIYDHQKSIIKIYDHNQADVQDYFPYVHDRNLKNCKYLERPKKCSFIKFWECIA